MQAPQRITGVDLMDSVLRTTMEMPQVVTYRDGKFCAATSFVLYDLVKGVPVKSIYPSVVINDKNKVITMFPAKNCGMKPL